MCAVLFKTMKQYVFFKEIKVNNNGTVPLNVIELKIQKMELTGTVLGNQDVSNYIEELQLAS